MTIGSAAAADPDGNMGNKYLVSDFLITIYPETPYQNEFNATITNQNNGAYGEGYWEISTSPAANHDPTKVQQTGYFNENFDTFTIGESLKFTPIEGTTYYLLVYTNYIPEGHDNRVSKDTNVTEFSDDVHPT
jgi:hypothetical protein